MTSSVQSSGATCHCQSILRDTLCWPQVLLGDCSTQALAGQASGVIQAVLQGRNSAVLALGQLGSGKTHTLLSSDLHDVHASSSAGGVSMHQLCLDDTRLC